MKTNQLQSQIAKLKKIKSELCIAKDKLEERIEDRETKFDERSEKWQESEKGQLFAETTEQ